MKSDCTFCGHSREKHCKAGTMHVEWKSDKQQDGRLKIQYPWVSDHCTLPLCCCPKYKPVTA